MKPANLKERAPPSSGSMKPAAGGDSSGFIKVAVLALITVAVFSVDNLLVEFTSGTTSFTNPTQQFYLLEVGAIVLLMVVGFFFVNAGKKGKALKSKKAQSFGKTETTQRAATPRTQTQDLTTEDDVDEMSEALDDCEESPLPTGGAAPQRREKSQGPSAPTKGHSVARWNQVIHNAAKTGDPTKAERLLTEIEWSGLKPDTISYNSVIHAFAKNGDIAQAQAQLERMKAKGVDTNVVSYNILMDACVKADDAEGAERWLERMIRDGVEPNEVSFATVIHARAKSGETELAERWLRKMIATGVEPNVVSYNSLIYACGRHGDAENAERWVNEMESRGLEPRVTTYTAVVDACAKSGDVPNAELWMEKMLAKGIEPNVVSYSSMIDACAKAGNAERAAFWHEQMCKQGVQPNAHSFSAVINACAKAGDVASSCKWLESMERLGVAADVVVYSGVLDACAKVQDAERAKIVFAQMRANGIAPNVVAYASLARPFAHKGDWEEVERLADELVSHKLAMNEYFLYAQLLAYACAKPKQPGRAEKAFKDAHSRGLDMNAHVTAALGRAVGRTRAAEIRKECGLPEEVEEVAQPPNRRRTAACGPRSSQ
eukprot:gnl/TRDRNA2_/TRDRNA2_165784_c0_seq4.p1 gnl/TRDRNA2_/TRDRNA2_165784_c0~~gnl/TRDRNA2_/TRDRNA2_165784_c0_seq4.p1  ORF type:complete len:621 (+),score=141.56 gnl/TRDRNA2_/TRDRNA2_165784_c0_seq4:57-1865(+)